MERHPRSNSQLTVSMSDGVVVIATPAEFDQDATEALLRTVGAAVTTGETVMLDLEPDHRWEPDRWPHPVASGDADAGDPARSAGAIGPGFVRLDTGRDTWTVDLVRHRFCRSAAPVDPRFVSAPSWTAIRAVWITADRTTVLTHAGTYVSAPSAWVPSAPGVVSAA